MRGVRAGDSGRGTAGRSSSPWASPGWDTPPTTSTTRDAPRSCGSSSCAPWRSRPPTTSLRTSTNLAPPPPPPPEAGLLGFLSTATPCIALVLRALVLHCSTLSFRCLRWGVEFAPNSQSSGCTSICLVSQLRSIGLIVYPVCS
jgi:hypothetical protein